MQENLKTNILAKHKWLRLVYMVLFLVVKCLVWWGILLIMVVQLITELVTNKTNIKLLEFSANLNMYIYQILAFLTYNSETKPFPFSAWPTESHKSPKENHTH